MPEHEKEHAELEAPEELNIFDRALLMVMPAFRPTLVVLAVLIGLVFGVLSAYRVGSAQAKESVIAIIHEETNPWKEAHERKISSLENDLKEMLPMVRQTDLRVNCLLEGVEADKCIVHPQQ